jgi:AcrR family transcriptional regulator
MARNDAGRARTDAEPATRRKRRAPGEARTALMESARELFATRGYAGTSTREIASHADASEVLLFRHFGTKAKLFDEAIIQPFRTFVAEYVTLWEQYSSEDQPVEEVCGEFVNGLYKLLREHRELVVALVAAHAYEFDVVDDEQGGVGNELGDAFTKLESLVVAERDRRGLNALDPPLTVRVTVGMVMAMAVLDEWLFPRGRRPSEQRLVNEMTLYMAHGVADRHAPD